MNRRPVSRRVRRDARRRARRYLLKAFEVALFVGIVGAFGFYFSEYTRESDDFVVREVVIHGLAELDDATVIRHAAIQSGGNMFTLNEREIEERIEALARVKACEVERVYPQTIAIHLEERYPVASLHVGATAYELDAEGVVLREYAPHELPHEPYITNVPGVEFVSAGDRIRHPALKAALRVRDAFYHSPLARELTVSEIAAYSPDDIRMYCEEIPYEVRWGRNRFERAAARFFALWRGLEGDLDCTAYLDLRFGDDVPCK